MASRLPSVDVPFTLYFKNQLINLIMCVSALVSSAIVIDSAPPGGQVHTHTHASEPTLRFSLRHLTVPMQYLQIDTRALWLTWWGNTAVEYIIISEQQTFKVAHRF